jgi:hypothetical protein
MEKCYRVSDVNEILNKLAKEPAYYHDGEDFYNGVCAVEGELMCLEPVMLEEPKVGKWEKRTWIIFDSEKTGFHCSECNTTWDSCTNFCPNCGAKMGVDK